MQYFYVWPYHQLWGLLFHPDITVMVDWALKINYLSIYLSTLSRQMNMGSLTCAHIWEPSLTLRPRQGMEPRVFGLEVRRSISELRLPITKPLHFSELVDEKSTFFSKQATGYINVRPGFNCAWLTETLWCHLTTLLEDCCWQTNRFVKSTLQFEDMLKVNVHH